MIIGKESAPHLRRKATVTRMMVDVLIALAPTLIFSFVVFPIKTLIFYLCSLAVMIGAEFVFVGLKNMMPNDGLKHSFKERFAYAYKGKYSINNVLTPAISAIIFTLIMPANAPIYAVIMGALFGIVVGKLVFGGLGSNIFNPAAVGMCFAKLCFGSQYGDYVSNWYCKVPDAVAGATPLGGTAESWFTNVVNNMGEYDLFDMFIGRIPGTLGEIYKITIIVGLIYLLIRRSADFRIVVSYLGTFAVLALVGGLCVYSINNAVNPLKFLAYQLLSGGVLFGATFMLTDPVTSPINAPTRIIYGMIAAVSTIFIRFFAALPEGVGFSILIANMVAVVLDHYEWSNPRYTWKKFILMGSILVVSVLTVFLVITYGDVYHV